MDLHLKDKVVFIAGASRGIGYGMAKAFIAEGAKVAITGRTESHLDKAKNELAALCDGDADSRLLSIAGDLTQTKAISAALNATVATLGPLHTLVANVGLGRSPLGFDVSDEDWDADIAQNLTGSVHLAREGVRRMLDQPADARKDANVIFVTSIAGVQALGSSLPYGATKAALNHTTHALAKLVGKDGIRVNAIAPGNIKFPGGNWEKNVEARPESWMRWIRREVALQRFGSVEEIADAALWLSSPRASFVTGSVIVVDGGQVK